MPLNPRQRRFVAEYLIDGNGTQAAIRAGYSKHTAQEQASRLLSHVMVKEALGKRQSAIATKLEVTQETITAELAKLAFSNMADYMKVGPDGDPYLDFSALSRDQAAALTEVTVEDYKDGRGEDARDVRKVKFKLADKRAALVDLGKSLGMFKDGAGPGLTINGNLNITRIERIIVDPVEPLELVDAGDTNR